MKDLGFTTLTSLLLFLCISGVKGQTAGNSTIILIGEILLGVIVFILVVLYLINWRLKILKIQKEKLEAEEKKLKQKAPENISGSFMVNKMPEGYVQPLGVSSNAGSSILLSKLPPSAPGSILLAAKNKADGTVTPTGSFIVNQLPPGFVAAPVGSSGSFVMNNGSKVTSGNGSKINQNLPPGMTLSAPSTSLPPGLPPGMNNVSSDKKENSSFIINKMPVDLHNNPITIEKKEGSFIINKLPLAAEKKEGSFVMNKVPTLTPPGSFIFNNTTPNGSSVYSGSHVQIKVPSNTPNSSFVSMPPGDLPPGLNGLGTEKKENNSLVLNNKRELSGSFIINKLPTSSTDMSYKEHSLPPGMMPPSHPVDIRSTLLLEAASSAALNTMVTSTTPTSETLDRPPGF